MLTLSLLPIPKALDLVYLPESLLHPFHALYSLALQLHFSLCGMKSSRVAKGKGFSLVVDFN